ncbi:hypothetical protein V493_04333 [Pseudogymnoascus sp. VKM F-4281 (FW-2241)]|nr:hypothetical protein V493_04333 [Pseudogymnoascus sp. VKM F-4281 (FW-2241)]
MSQNIIAWLVEYDVGIVGDRRLGVDDSTNHVAGSNDYSGKERPERKRATALRRKGGHGKERPPPKISAASRVNDCSRKERLPEEGAAAQVRPKERATAIGNNDCRRKEPRTYKATSSSGKNDFRVMKRHWERTTPM